MSEKLNEVPSGMESIETNKNYITTRGNLSKLGELHLNLLKWAEEQGYHRELDSIIIETYHPMGEGDEEIQIYLPVQELKYKSGSRIKDPPAITLQLFLVKLTI